MKKLLAVFFTLALVFTAIGSTPTMAAGSVESILWVDDDLQLKHYVMNKKPLYNSPGNPSAVGYVEWQNVTVNQAWYLINTSLEQKWIGYNV
ncbi:hypothetical protein AB1I92_09500 [Bacillus mobilis]|uniref:Uncharacterized protein n=2 Tax=Bacillus cereus group TaxID=86661 RepID=A0A1C4CNV4_BACCE|nr:MULTISPECIES: hypothetical protein [Bacillus cereus group]MCC2463709.1 hypothetical protein [Bacillus mobilis]MCU5436542.1 hypothetical protein [Bacillus mobilis]MCU5595767.1 hypothetical protein [Bacillus mobilis]MCU5739713.1 hypothetical protein [Bacillus mobilis]MCU9562464.1 hypothetical protein [Bacillus mobilis]